MFNLNLTLEPLPSGAYELTFTAEYGEVKCTMVHVFKPEEFTVDNVVAAVNGSASILGELIEVGDVALSPISMFAKERKLDS